MHIYYVLFCIIVLTREQRKRRGQECPLDFLDMQMYGDPCIAQKGFSHEVMKFLNPKLTTLQSCDPHQA